MSGRPPPSPRPDPARPGGSSDADAAELRAAYRAWLHAHHPDHGGDPAAFPAGLLAWRRTLQDSTSAAGSRPALTFHRTRRRSSWPAWLPRPAWTRRQAVPSRPARVR